MDEIETKITETLKEFDAQKFSSEGALFASSIITEAYLKTLLSLGIEILSKIDSSKNRKEIGEHYVNMFKDQLTHTLSTKTAKKN